MTVILLLFGNNLECPKSLFSSSGGKGKNTSRRRSSYLGGNISNRQTSSSHEDYDSSSNINQSSFVSNLDLDDVALVCSTDKSGTSPTLNNAKRNGEYGNYGNYSDDNESCNSFSDEFMDIDDSDDEQDIGEVEDNIVVHKKGDYSISYQKKKLEEPTQRHQLNHLFSPVRIHFNYPNPQCVCGSLSHKTCQKSNNPSQSAEFHGHKYTTMKQLTILRQEKLNYIEQQLKAQNSSNEMELIDKPPIICDCMKHLPKSQTLPLIQKRPIFPVFQSTKQVTNDESLAMIHYPCKPHYCSPDREQVSNSSSCVSNVTKSLGSYKSISQQNLYMCNQQNKEQITNIPEYFSNYKQYSTMKCDVHRNKSTHLQYQTSSCSNCSGDFEACQTQSVGITKLNHSSSKPDYDLKYCDSSRSLNAPTILSSQLNNNSKLCSVENGSNSFNNSIMLTHADATSSTSSISSNNELIFANACKACQNDHVKSCENLLSLGATKVIKPKVSGTSETTGHQDIKVILVQEKSGQVSTQLS